MGDTVSNAAIRRAAARWKVPYPLFRALIMQESGGQKHVTSPAGAYGPAQLMPGTAAGLGVNPRRPRQNLMGGAEYLRKMYLHFGSWRLALAAYNAGPGAVEEHGGIPPYEETQNYVRSVLKAAGAFGKAPSGSPRSILGGGSPAPSEGGGVLGGLSALAQGEYDPTVALQELMQGGSGRMTSKLQIPDMPGMMGGKAQGGKVDIGKWLNIPKPTGPNKVKLNPQVLRFAARLGQQLGSPLTAFDNSHHSQYTVNGNVSRHWTGDAIDIGASGARLKRLGYLALRQAGMSRTAARRAAAKGGLFNVGGWQIIFATNIGGNHYDHIHIGR